MPDERDGLELADAYKVGNGVPGPCDAFEQLFVSFGNSIHILYPPQPFFQASNACGQLTKSGKFTPWRLASS